MENFESLQVTEQGNLIFRQLLNKKMKSMELKGKRREINSAERLIKQAKSSLEAKIEQL